MSKDKAFDSLDETFNIEPDEVQEVEIVKKRDEPLQMTNKEDDIKKDYTYQRAQLYDLVEKMQETLNESMDAAMQSAHPRAYEVCFNGAKATADVVEKLADLQKKMKELEVEETKVQNNNTQNNIFLSGSTEELLKSLKDAGSISNNPIHEDK